MVIRTRSDSRDQLLHLGQFLLVDAEVFFENGRLCEAFTARLTRERSLARVCEMVASHVEAVGERTTAHGAAELLFDRVRVLLATVTAEFGGRGEHQVAVAARVVAHLAVVALSVFGEYGETREAEATRSARQRHRLWARPTVDLQMVLLAECARTELAAERPHARMHRTVSLQIVLVAERLAADGTRELVQG